VRAYNEGIAQEMRDAAPDADDFTWPEPREADEWPDPLFDSARGYVKQVDRRISRPASGSLFSSPMCVRTAAARSSLSARPNGVLAIAERSRARQCPATATAFVADGIKMEETIVRRTGIIAAALIAATPARVASAA
jgi:hypothetical protein